MRDLVYMIRFFSIVTPIPPLMAPALMAVAGVATALIVLDGGRSAAALTPLLLLQLFAASSGFMVPARRGHYDLLLTGGYGRVRIAATHWAASILPGIAMWLGVGTIGIAAADGPGGSVLSSGSAVALTLVSTVPWAATIALPRFTAAIAWLLMLATAAAVFPADRAHAVLDPLDSPSSWLTASLAVTLYPVALVGQDLTGARAALAIPAVIVAAGSMVAAFVWIGRRDIPLEAAQ